MKLDKLQELLQLKIREQAAKAVCRRPVSLEQNATYKKQEKTIS